MFDEAQSKEWSSCLNSKVIERVDLKGIPRDQVIHARWVLTWNQATQAIELPRPGWFSWVIRTPISARTAATTASRGSNLLFLATVVQLGFRVFSLDAQTAFLSGDASERPAPLYVRPPADVAAGLHLGPMRC